MLPGSVKLCIIQCREAFCSVVLYLHAFGEGSRLGLMLQVGLVCKISSQGSVALQHYDAIMRYISQPPLLLDVHIHKPMLNARTWMDSLLAFFPGLQVGFS